MTDPAPDLDLDRLEEMIQKFTYIGWDSTSGYDWRFPIRSPDNPEGEFEHPEIEETIFSLIALARRQAEDIGRLEGDVRQLREAVRQLTDPSIIPDEDRKALAGLRDDLQYIAKMKELRAEIARLRAEPDDPKSEPAP